MANVYTDQKSYLHHSKQVFSCLEMKWIVLCVILIIFAAFLACSHAFRADTHQKPSLLSVKRFWPHEQSDLSADPDTIFGRLPNGFGFILKENHTPQDRVSMHLYIQAGSLYENDDEQGLAHYLEHMLFEGTTHFPPGEMVKYFQRIGMQYGPDANAHTGFANTVYDVILPNGNPQSIAEGLMVLRDYAEGALLLPEEVEQEKNVILAEMRSRDSADFRAFKAALGFELPAFLISRRFPIGQADVIKQIDANRLRDFYNAWYRPERMILIMVGDFNLQHTQKLIAERFADFKARSEPRSLPQMGHFMHQGVKPFYHHEKEMGATSVSIETIVNKSQPKDSIQWQHQALTRQLADRMMQNRLDDLLQQPQTVFTSAVAISGYYLQQIEYAEISAECEPDKWQQTLTTIEQQLRQALIYGFTTPELERVKKNYLAHLERDLKEAGTRDSKDLTHDIMASLSSWRIFQSPQQRWKLLHPLLESITLDQVNSAFVKTWAVPHRLILVTGNADLTSAGQSGKSQILEVYQASSKTSVKQLEQQQAAVFPYLPVPETSGEIVQRRSIENTGIEQVVFENGVTMHLKRTSFKTDQVLVNLAFGNGRASEPADQSGLAQMTQEVINGSGFGALNLAALQRALAGRLASIELDVRETMFVVKGETTTAELPLLFQLLYTFVQDPGCHPQAYKLALKRLKQEYEALTSSVEGLMQLEGDRFLASGDTRFGQAPWQQTQQITLQQIKEWFFTQLRQMPIELAVVGDIDPQIVVDLTARYFGSLPQRNSQEIKYNDQHPRFPVGRSLKLKANSRIAKALTVVAYPTEDFWDIQRTRRLNMLAEVFSERLRVSIRENLGAAYSPYAYNHPYRAYQEYGLLKIYVQVAPDQAEAIAAEVQKLSAQLATQGVNPDEFQRSLDPRLTGLKDLLQTNSYWLNSVMTGAARYPQQLDWARTMESDYAAITAEEISYMAQKYLDNRKAAVIIILPEGVSTN